MARLGAKCRGEEDDGLELKDISTNVSVLLSRNVTRDTQIKLYGSSKAEG